MGSAEPAAAPKTDRPLAGRYAAGAGITLAGRATNKGLLLVVQAYLARALEPTAFGLFAIGWTILRLLTLLGALGVDHAVVFHGSRVWQRNDEELRSTISHSMRLALGIAVLLAAAGWLCSPWLASVLAAGEPGLLFVLRAFFLVLPFVVASRMLCAVTRITQRMDLSVLAEDLVLPITHLILVLVLINAGYGLRGAVWGTVFSYGASVIVATFFVIRLFPGSLSYTRIDFGRLREILAFAVPSSLAGMFMVLTLRVDRIIVALIGSAADVGIYQAAAQFSTFAALLLSGLGGAAAPHVSRLHHEADQRGLHQVFITSVRWGLYLGLPAVLTLIAIPREVMVTIFGPAFLEGAGVLLTLSLGQLATLSTGAVSVFLVMTGRQKAWLRLSGSMLVLNVALSLYLGQRLGVIGVAVATAIVMALHFTGGLLLTRRLVGLWPYDRTILKPLVAGGATALVLFAIRGLEMAPLAQLFVTSAIALATFAGVLLWTGLEREDLDALALLRIRIR